MRQLFLTSVMLFFYMVCIANVRTDSFELTFSTDDYSFSTDSQGNLVILSNTPVSYPEMEVPGLPLSSINYAIPGDYSYVSSDITLNKKLIKSDIRIAQSPAPIPTDGSAQTPTQAISYSLTEVYPAENCKYTMSNTWNDISVLHFLVCPFIYDAAQKNLYFVESMNVRVKSTDTPSSSKLSKRSPSLNFVKELVINPNMIESLVKDEIQKKPSAERVDYLIVTTEELKPTFEPLIRWKKTKGLYSKIITVEEIQKSFSGQSTQLKLKECLYYMYSNNSLKYVLLGGDDTVVPVQGCYGAVGTKYTDSSIPTDLFYACFGGSFNWDGNGNGIFGETDDKVDLTQSIYITRIPVRTIQDTETVVQRIISYENSTSFSNKILMSGTRLWGMCDQQSDAEAKGDRLYDYYIKPYWCGDRFKFYDTSVFLPDESALSYNADNLMTALSYGYTFFDMATHGSQTSWSVNSGGNYNVTRASKQCNDKYTIITTMACNTNAFDSSNTSGFNDPCLSEALIRNSNSGIVAYLGSSRYGWGTGAYSDGTGNGYLGSSLLYESQFYKNLFSDHSVEKNLGAIVALTKTKMSTNCYANGSYRWLQFSLNPIGDPETPIFIEQPLEFNDINFSHNGSTCTIDTGVEDCRICIMSADDEGSSFYKVIEGSKQLSVSELPPVCSICITKPAYKPYRFLFINDKVITESMEYDCDMAVFGKSEVTSDKEVNTTIKKGRTTINAGTTVLGPGSTVEKGAELIINPIKK